MSRNNMNQWQIKISQVGIAAILALTPSAGFAADTEGDSVKLYNKIKAESNSDKALAMRLQLGQMLEKMGFNNLAMREYMTAAKTSSQWGSALTALFNLANRLDDQAYLGFCVDQAGNNSTFALAKSADFIYRTGETALLRKNYSYAAQILGTVPKGSERYFKARYLMALALLKADKASEAVAVLKDLETGAQKLDEGDYNRSAAIAGLARAYYKMGNWEKALEYYRQVPKDSELWHDVLIEISWTSFRKGDFREVLGSLGALHTPYFEKFFIMESVLLRSFVYLSICSLTEMEKTLGLFEKMYTPLKERVNRSLVDIGRYTDFLKYSEDSLSKLNEGYFAKDDNNRAVPLAMARTLSRDPSFKAAHKVVLNLREERQAFKDMDDDWKKSALGQSSVGFLDSRLNEASKAAGLRARTHMEEKQKEIERLFRQYDFAKYEMVAEAKQQIKQTAENKDEKKSRTVTDSLDRQFFLSKGVEYYPFNGEYWLDEVGNSHFIGQSHCAKK